MIRQLDIDDIRWLIGSLTLAMLLHVGHLTPWVSVFIFALFAWRYTITIKGWKLPSIWLLMPLTLIAGLGIILTYKSLFGRDAGVALLTIMLSLKLMETHDKRDYILIILAAYFLTTASFLFNQSLLVGAYILLPILALTTTLVGLSHPQSRLDWRFKSKLAGKLLLQSIPTMLILFFLFPRIPGPLWGMPEDSYSSMTGLSDSMTPGNISNLTRSGKTAFRVTFKGKIPAQNQLYWRGPVLWHYDGRSWTMSSSDLKIPPEQLLLKGVPIQYTVTLEPHNRNWLLMLDMPNTLPPNTQLTRDMQVLSRDPVRNRIRYEVSSNLEYTLAPELNPLSRELNLQINDDENPRTIQLAKSWNQAKQSPEDIIKSALTMFREQAFAYTLQPPLLSTSNSIDDFLFNTQRGFCEHYASSFVFLMRAAGMPARVVTGYQGGEINPVGNYLIVRQSDAHAWAEVWLENRGWVRIDPTAAVSPSRIESGIDSALPDNDILPIMSRAEFPILRKIYLNWDSINNHWNQYVLGYNQQRQLDLLSKLAGNKVSWQDMVIGMMICLASAGLIAGYFLLKTQKLKLDPAQALYMQFLRKLAPTGLTRAQHEGELDFSNRAIKRLPHKSKEITQITLSYQQLRYGNSKSTEHLTATLATFKKLIQEFNLKSPPSID